MIRPYDPQLYALLHQGTPGDVAFYLDACRGAERVLELGAGYGRVTLALAVAGHEVCGLELDAGLLGLCRERLSALPDAVQRRVRLLQGDMRTPALEGAFERVLIPFGGLYCLGSEAEVIRCLRAARQLLAPGGRLIFDGYAADGFHEECVPEDYPDDQLEEVALIAAGGVAYEVLERSSWERERQHIVATYVHRPLGGGEPIEHAIEQRYLLASEVPGLLAASGLSLLAIQGSFQGAPYDDESEVMIVQAVP